MDQTYEEVVMAWKRSFLVVANVTSGSEELIQTLAERGRKEPAHFTLLIPATPFGGGRTAASETLDESLREMRDAGLEADGSVGDADPIIAVTETWDPKKYDEIIVSTLPMRLSKWLHAGLPERIAKLTGAPVTHVVSQPPKPAVPVAPPPARDEPGRVLGPLSVLGWGGRKT
jgi:hypothetical protein